MKVLVTGVNGFIGKRLAKSLMSRNHEVIGLDCGINCHVQGVYKYFSGSVLDENLVRKAVEKAESVVHLAAITEHNQIVGKPEEAMRINLQGTKNVLDAFSESDAKVFVYSSSGKVYGDVGKLPLKEDYPTKPMNILGKSKLKTEDLIKANVKDGKGYVIFRIFNVYGKDQKSNFVLPTILNQLEVSNELILGDIKSKRDFVFIDDVINAFNLAIESKISGVKILNVCTGEPHNVEDIISIIKKIKCHDIKVNIDTSKFRSDEKNVEYGSYENIKKELGWKPKYSLESGLKKVLK